MRTSNYNLYTIKDISFNSDIISYKLMLKSGMIRKLNSGFYVWLPIGLIILKNIIKLIKKEMNKINFLEINMPIAQSANLWKKSKRLKKYGLELIKFYDRKKKLFILSPTNEEIISKIISNEITSYKQLPLKFFQIKTKFRDEIRPNLGVIRSREFIMKDAYSFHNSKKCLKKIYNNIYKTYIKIFKKLGLFFNIIKANSGEIGGKLSHEFHILIKKKKNNNYYLNKNNNINKKKKNIEKNRQIFFFNILNKKINNKLKLLNKNLIKIIIVNFKNKNIILLIPKNSKINIYKIYKLNNICKPFNFLSKNKIKKLLIKNFNSIKYLFLNFTIIADYSILKMKNFLIKFNNIKAFLINLNWIKNLKLFYLADLLNYSKKKNIINNLYINKSIEVGHIFKIGNKYSKIINKCNFKKNIHMGCYGIGITRLIAAIIEQNYDKKGIIWTNKLAPFKVSILPINLYKYKIVNDITEKIYMNLFKKKINIILDDRKIQIGKMFNDIELIGIPHLIIISNKNCKNGFIEYKYRSNNKIIFLKKEYIINYILKKII
ncbi:MAG: proline--tRNA ligase [Enterobacteriaceae bacterium PSpyr]|nr:MAG: proline--tRNA ligase [Enterobacteriaceae bacterium PSpyr]